jgi:predicted peptidase
MKFSVPPRAGLLVALLALSPASVRAQNATPVNAFLARAYKNSRGETMPYRLFVPENYEAAKKYPLVLWLHGAAGRGNDNLLHISEGNSLGSHVWAKPENQAKNPAFVLAPQCPEGNWWTEPREIQPSHSLKLALEILNAVEMEFNIDADRVYVAGQSMGGEGTWAAITYHPDKFAAAVPLCAYGDPTKARVIARMPIWAFQGQADEVVPLDRVRAMIAALRASGSTVKYTEYPGVGHNVWERAFVEPDLVPWVFAQRRKANLK